MSVSLIYQIFLLDESKPRPFQDPPSSEGGVADAQQFGATPDDAIDDSDSINEGVSALAGGGGGVLTVDGGTFLLEDPVRLRDDVIIEIGAGTTVRWMGDIGGRMFTTSLRNPLQRAGVIGVGAVIDPNETAEIIFDLHSPQFSRFRGFQIQGGTATTRVFRVLANATGSTGFRGQTNAVYNQFEDIFVAGKCGTVIELGGRDADSVVTLNHFQDIVGTDVNDVGIRVIQWTDNNLFSGVIRFELKANNATGVILNDSSTPSQEAGVFSNSFEFLAVDTFEGPLTGRKGIVLNYSRRTVIYHYYQAPEAEGGAIVDNHSASHYIVRVGRQGGSEITIHDKHVVTD